MIVLAGTIGWPYKTSQDVGAARTTSRGRQVALGLARGVSEPFYAINKG